MTVALPLLKSVLAPLAKTVLISLGESAGISATNAAIQKKIYRSGHPLELASRTTALIISTEEMEDIMKVVRITNKSN